MQSQVISPPFIFMADQFRNIFGRLSGKMAFIYTCTYILKEYVCVKLGNVPNSVNILFCLV